MNGITLPLIHRSRLFLKTVVRGMCMLSSNSSFSYQISESESESESSLSSSSSLCDFLGADKFKRKFLIGKYGGGGGGKQNLVPVETLRGKILALYFDDSSVPAYYIDFYNTLKRTKPDAAFEMIHVAPREYDPSLFAVDMSKLPWLSVPCEDLDWRTYLFRLYYSNRHAWGNIVLIDTKDNKIQVLTKNSDAVRCIYSYGPLYYPFTLARIRQLDAHSKQLGRETSISAILRSDSCDYLLDPQSNKVPISSLHNKDVLIYGFIDKKTDDIVSQLGEIRNKFQGVEIVSVNLNYNGGDGKYETLWEDHLKQISWLHLPVLDENIWYIRNMMLKKKLCQNSGDPILFVKPKGESLLDPYGFQVLQKFGFQAFPFTRKAAALSLLTRLKGFSFKSFVDEARQLRLDFNSLIRNKADGGTEIVSLSNILEGRGARGILLLFGNSRNCSRGQLNSLMKVYLNQNESSSFEVIFVSTDFDTQSFHGLFSKMPWFAFQRPLEKRELNDLHKRTIHANFMRYSHFLAFGPDQLLVQVGLLKKSYENCMFPFSNDAESTDHLTYCINISSNWSGEADGTIFHEGDGWGRGIANDQAHKEVWFYGRRH